MQLFVNLPVDDLERSIDFFTALGFEFDPRFTDENATCMLVGDDAFFMLLVRPYFEGFAPKPIGDTVGATTALYAVMVDSREAVDEMVHKALANGGKPSKDPQDHGFMYQWGFLDPDGHVFEVGWMDPAALEGDGPSGA